MTPFPMQAVILAAGRSTRTYPLTSTRPKPLVPVWDRPLLEHQLAQLDGWIDEALLVVGYRRDRIESHFGRRFGGLKLRYVHQRTPRGTADALLAARELVTGRTIIINGDDFYHRDDLRALARTDTGRGLVAVRAADPQNRAVLRIEDDAVVDILEKPAEPPADAWCSVGGYCVEREDLSRLDELTLSPRGELELPDFIMKIANVTPVRPHYLRRLWMPLTYAWDVLGIALRVCHDAAAARDLGIAIEDPESLRRRDDVRWGRNVSVDGPFFAGPGVFLGDGCTLEGPVVLLSGARVGAGAHLRRVVAFGGATVGREARVWDSVLGEGTVVGERARVASRPGTVLRVAVQDRIVTPDIERLGIVAGDGGRIEAGAVVPAGTLLEAGRRFP